MKTIKKLAVLLVSLLLLVFIIPVGFIVLGIGGVAVAIFGDVIIFVMAIVLICVGIKFLRKK